MCWWKRLEPFKPGAPESELCFSEILSSFFQRARRPLWALSESSSLPFPILTLALGRRGQGRFCAQEQTEGQELD